MRKPIAVVAILLLGGACSDDEARRDGASEAGVEVDSEGVDQLLEDALAAHAEGDVEAALDGYAAVREKDPQNKFAHYNIGLIEQTTGNNESAESNYRRALAIDPDYVPALFNLAILRTAEAPREAIDLYRHLVEVDAENAGAWLNLSFVLRSVDDFEAASEALETAIELDPSLADRVEGATTPAASNG